MRSPELLRRTVFAGSLLLTNCSQPATVESRPVGTPPGGQRIEVPILSENDRIKDLAKTVGNLLLSQKLDEISRYYPQEYKNDKKGLEIIYDHFRFFNDPSCRDKKVVNTEDVKDVDMGKPAKVVAVSLDGQCLMKFRFPGTGLSFAEGGVGASFTQGLGKRIIIGFEKYPDGKWYLATIIPDFVPQK